ncbi:hypothetical protein J6590_038503 [Homalodisca vitripennis]|nr:hypothetical protein J6590_038503 [Homalodisca vitripennis]
MTEYSLTVALRFWIWCSKQREEHGSVAYNTYHPLKLTTQIIFPRIRPTGSSSKVSQFSLPHIRHLTSDCATLGVFVQG